MTLDLPTGNEDKGIGSSHIWVIEPFLDFGYKLNRFELIGFANFGFPVNEHDEDEADLELSWNLSFLYLITDRFHYLVEFDGEHDFGGEKDGFNMVNISPGIKYQVLKRQEALSRCVGAAASDSGQGILRGTSLLRFLPLLTGRVQFRRASESRHDDKTEGSGRHI